MRKAVLALLGIGLVAGGFALGRRDLPSPRRTVAETSVGAITRTPTIRANAQPVLPAPAVDPTLREDLADRDPKVRATAFHELMQANAVDRETALAASNDADLEVAANATRVLGSLYAEGKVSRDELVTRIENKQLPEKVRAMALDGLAAVPSEETTTFLIAQSRSAAADDRRVAAIHLRGQTSARAMPALIEMLADQDESVRYNVIEGLKARSRGRDFGTDVAAWRAWWQSRKP